MEPYIVDILCKSADPNRDLREAHAVVCAIAETPQSAEVMARNLVMSHSMIVESIAGVNLKSASQPDEFQELEDTLLQKARVRTPPCALFLSAYQPGHEEFGAQSLGVPSVDKSNN